MVRRLWRRRARWGWAQKGSLVPTTQTCLGSKNRCLATKLAWPFRVATSPPASSQRGADRRANDAPRGGDWGSGCVPGVGASRTCLGRRPCGAKCSPTGPWPSSAGVQHHLRLPRDTRSRGAAAVAPRRHARNSECPRNTRVKLQHSPGTTTFWGEKKRREKKRGKDCAADEMLRRGALTPSAVAAFQRAVMAAGQKLMVLFAFFAEPASLLPASSPFSLWFLPIPLPFHTPASSFPLSSTLFFSPSSSSPKGDSGHPGDFLPLVGRAGRRLHPVLRPGLAVPTPSSSALPLFSSFFSFFLFSSSFYLSFVHSFSLFVTPDSDRELRTGARGCCLSESRQHQ